MSKQTSVVGTVVLTVCVTSLVLVGGWFAVPRFFNPPPPASTTAPEPADAPVTPHRKGRSKAAVPADAPQADSAPVAADATVAAVATNTADDRAAVPPPSGGFAPAPPPDVVPPQTAKDQAEPPSADATADPKTIVAEAQRRAEAKFYRYDGLLESFDSKDRVTQKRWTFDREGSHGQSKSVIRFTAPAEVKGVALLIVNHPERASDQWMWTPAIERDRRISLQDRSTRFFGTDFSFEDLEERDVEQYEYAMLGTESVDGAPCWKIQFTPKASRASQYTRSIAWIRQDNYTYARQDHYVGSDVVRRLQCSRIENVQGIWTARQMEMTDMRRGTRTRLTLQQVAYNAAMRDEDFTLQAIRR